MLSRKVRSQTSSSARFVAIMAISYAGVLTMAYPVQAEPIFTPYEIEACVRETSSKHSEYAILDCVGRAAADCMLTPRGDTTVGMVLCLNGEFDYWDARLKAAYAERMASDEANDTEKSELGAVTSSVAENLRLMQRAWTSFRDASCQYEQARWMGGSGGRTAFAACRMQETARQALKLEGRWGQ